jgi:hypothetical protein
MKQEMDQYFLLSWDLRGGESGYELTLSLLNILEFSPPKSRIYEALEKIILMPTIMSISEGIIMHWTLEETEKRRVTLIWSPLYSWRVYMAFKLLMMLINSSSLR